MIGDAKRKAVTEQVTKAVKSASGLVLAALITAGAALLVAVAAFFVALRRPAHD
ncbi:MAG: hypothetical protein JWO67_5378 [Streptosporangiaceae bacterium]|nr:hypothetical protein [Streptosporangiaceae bacterium]